MAYFLSQAVLFRKATLSGTPLKSTTTLKQTIPYPYVKLKPSKQSISSTQTSYLIETDALNLSTLLATLEQLYAPNHLPSNNDAYTSRSLLARCALYHDIQVQKSLDYFITTLSKTLEQIGKGKKFKKNARLNQKQYILLFSKIYRALVNDRIPSYDTSLEEEVKRDYKVDKSFSIRRLLFSLVDLWTNEMSSTTYSTFIHSLLKQIIDLETFTFRNDETIRIDLKSYNSTSNWTLGYKTLAIDETDKLGVREKQRQQQEQYLKEYQLEYQPEYQLEFQPECRQEYQQEYQPDRQQLDQQQHLHQQLQRNQPSSLSQQPQQLKQPQQPQQPHQPIKPTNTPMKVQLNLPSVTTPMPSSNLTTSSMDDNSIDIDVDEYLQRYSQLEKSMPAKYNTDTNATFGSVSTRSLSLPLPPQTPRGNDGSGVARSPIQTSPNMTITTHEHPIGMLYSIGLKARKVKEIGNTEEFQVKLGRVLTRRVQTDLTVACRNTRLDVSGNQEFILE